jgi:hypothetical protein
MPPAEKSGGLGRQIGRGRTANQGGGRALQILGSLIKGMWDCGIMTWGALRCLAVSGNAAPLILRLCAGRFCEVLRDRLGGLSEKTPIESVHFQEMRHKSGIG